MKTKNISEIVVHVGLHKTATSSIQCSLGDQSNEKLLKGKGYLYPREWPINHSIPVYSAFCDHPEAYHINVRQKLSESQVKKTNKIYLRSLKEEVAKKRPRKLIISGEDISMLSIKNLQRFKDFLSFAFEPAVIRVVLYVRNPILLSISKIQEDIKAGQHTLESAININLGSKEHSIRKRIEDVVGVFGKDLTEVYPFEEAVRHAQGPVGHFLSIIGFNKDEIAKFRFEKSNESLSALAVDMISFINKKLPLFKGGVINAPRESGDILSIAKVKGAKFDLTWEKKKELREKYNDEIIWLRDGCGIDYGDVVKEVEVDKKRKISSEQLLQIKEAHAGAPSFIQGLMIEYLNGVAEKDVEVNRDELRALVVDLEKLVTTEARFRKILRIDDAVDLAEIYREIALFLEGCNEVNSALTIMKKARELRPDGPFICEKIKAYERSIKM